MGLLTLDRVVRAGDLFNSLEREEERVPDRKFEVKMNPRLEELIEIFGKAKKDIPGEIYDEYVRLSQDNYSATDIEKLSLIITEQNIDNFSSKYGLFLSSLINRSPDKNITIHTCHLETPPNYIGFKNNGKIINVNGNAGDFLGYEMSMGKIIVNGNTGNATGFDMTGGEIIINEDYKYLSPCIEGGNIYHKGVQLIKNGKKIPGAEIKWF